MKIQKPCTYLHIRCIEVDFTKFENKKVGPILRHRDVITESGSVISLGLVQDLILLRHPGYQQLFAVIGSRADPVCVPGISNPENIDVGFTSAVDSIHSSLSYALKITRLVRDSFKKWARG